MSALTKILTGAAGLAAVVGFASPAAAQYYPGYGYGNNQNVLGTIINGVLGGGQYGYGNQYGQGGQQLAVSQCARAVEGRLGGGYGGYNNGYGGYNSGYGNYGYSQGYSRGRVVGITRVEQRSSGIRVRGVASSSSGNGGGYGGGYGAQADLSFSCKVDYRGRIVDLDLDRRYAGYNNGYYRGY